jgi:hypothetical protein
VPSRRSTAPHETQPPPPGESSAAAWRGSRLEVGINDLANCSDEIKMLEREIEDHATERWTPVMIALVRLLRYAKCVLFSAYTPHRSSKVDFDDVESPLPAGAAVPARSGQSGSSWAVAQSAHGTRPRRSELMGCRACRRWAAAANVEQSTAEYPTSSSFRERFRVSREIHVEETKYATDLIDSSLSSQCFLLKAYLCHCY